MKVLGCTGGIGSGKTYIASIFNKMGVPVYSSDDRAKFLYDTDSQLRGELVQLLGDEIIAGGTIQRKLIAEKIFNNRALLDKMEQLVHPAVLRDFSRWQKEVIRENNTAGEEVPFVVLESAILLEKPLVRGCADRVMTVSAPLELRVERVMARDGVSREKVMERMAAQWGDEKREAMADFIIFADGKAALLPQICQVYNIMKNINKLEDGNR